MKSIRLTNKSSETLCSRITMFVHLLSNASLDTFPNNTLTDFSTVLSTPLALYEDDWEMGLSEIHLPFTMLMVAKKEDIWIQQIEYLDDKVLETLKKIEDLSKYNCKIEHANDGDYYKVTVPDDIILKFEDEQAGLPLIIYGDSDRVFHGQETFEPILGSIQVCKSTKTSRLKREMMQIGSGHYDSLEDMLKAFTVSGMTFSTVNNNFVQCTKDSKSTVNVWRFSEQLCNMLGFRKQSIQGTSTTAKHLADPFPGMHCVMVLTNIIEESFVGDTKAPLLRMLPIQFDVKFNHMMTYQCFPVQYKKVLQQQIDCIRILLVDDTGRALPLAKDRGRVALTLHFRRNGALSSRQND